MCVRGVETSDLLLEDPDVDLVRLLVCLSDVLEGR